MTLMRSPCSKTAYASAKLRLGIRHAKLVFRDVIIDLGKRVCMVQRSIELIAKAGNRRQDRKPLTFVAGVVLLVVGHWSMKRGHEARWSSGLVSVENPTVPNFVTRGPLSLRGRADRAKAAEILGRSRKERDKDECQESRKARYSADSVIVREHSDIRGALQYARKHSYVRGALQCTEGLLRSDEDWWW